VIADLLRPIDLKYWQLLIAPPISAGPATPP
jgi:hypothetical protein